MKTWVVFKYNKNLHFGKIIQCENINNFDYVFVKLYCKSKYRIRPTINIKRYDILEFFSTKEEMIDAYAEEFI